MKWEKRIKLKSTSIRPSISIFHKKDFGRKAHSLNNTAVFLYEKEPARAKEYMQKALAISEQIQDLDGQATYLHNLGAVSSKMNELEQAALYYTAALSIRREIQDYVGLKDTLYNLALLWSNLGDHNSSSSSGRSCCDRPKVQLYIFSPRHRGIRRAKKSVWESVMRIAERHARHYMAYAYEHRDDWDWFDDEWGQILRSAWEWVKHQDASLAVSLFEYSNPYRSTKLMAG